MKPITLKSKSSLFFILTGLVILTSTQSVGQTFEDHDTKADFNKYTTYAWIAPGDSVLNRVRKDKLFGGTIMYVANDQIKKRGMALDTLQPDALFIFQTVVDDRTQYSQSPTLSVGVAVAGPGYYAGGSAPVAGGKITASDYIEGTLTFEMYDAKTGSLLWKGGTKKDFKNQDDISIIISESVVKIFKKFPKKAVKSK
jgi:hypothetical protein